MKKIETLAELREMRRTSQEDLALSLGVRQSTISKLEHKPNPSINQLRAFVEALGGTLQVVARFAGTTVEFVGSEEGPPASG